MTQPALEFHPEAIAEARAARSWYAQRSTAAANAFMEEVDHAVEQISAAPDRWPIFAGSARRYLLRRFPYMVVYRQTDTGIQVLAVAHARRRPGYWKKREPSAP